MAWIFDQVVQLGWQFKAKADYGVLLSKKRLLVIKLVVHSCLYEVLNSLLNESEREKRRSNELQTWLQVGGKEGRGGGCRFFAKSIGTEIFFLVFWIRWRLTDSVC